MLNPIVLSIPVFFFLIGIEIIYDRITHKNLYRMNDAVSNISCGIFEQITGVFSKVITVAVYDMLYQHYRFFTIPDSWIWLLVLFLGIDLAYYWAHRMSHQINIFWVGHVVHHQSEEYNLSVALRQGAIQKIFTAFFYLPLALFGFSTYWFIFLGAFNTLYQFWIHTETIKKLGPFEWILNTPSHHRVHHGRNPKYIDRNHAGVFIIWDKLFGTFQKEEEHPVYGITTPVHTWDAVTSHVRPLQNLWNDWRMMKEWKYKIQLLFMKPGWLPQKYGGHRVPVEVSVEMYQKFDTKLNPQMNWYLLIHFIFILVGTSFFLFGLAKLSQTEQIVFTLLISFSIMITGFLFEGKKWGKWMEMIRLLVTGFVLVTFFSGASFKIPLAIFLVLTVFISIYWMNRFYNSRSLPANNFQKLESGLQGEIS